MKKRGSVLLCLKEQVEIRDKSLVIELENEILDFFNKFDLFYHYNVNSRMMKLINTKTYKTYDQIAEELEIDRMIVYRFVKREEDFVRQVNKTYKKYKELEKYL